MTEVEALKTKIEKLEEDLAKLAVPKVETKTVYISKERKLQKFSGRPVKDTDPSVEEWIEDVTYHIKNISTKEAQIEFLVDHLQGQARDEIRTRSETERNTPDKILTILQDLFQDADSIAQIQQQFYQRDQKPGESLQQYSLVLLKLVDRMMKKGVGVIGNRELMLKERFIDGVTDKQLRREMRRFSIEHAASNFQDFRTVVFKWVQDQKADVAEVHQSAEQVELQVDQAQASKLEQPSELLKMLSAQQELLEAQQKQIDLLTDLCQQTNRPSSFVGYQSRRGRGRGQYSQRQGSRGRGAQRGRGYNNACYNCNKEGHFARDCPGPNPQMNNVQVITNSQATAGGATNQLNY